jgi:nicotinate phosphoribosyltransferase
VFGGVYKLAAVEENGVYLPKIKISETVEKITTPGFKKRVPHFQPRDRAGHRRLRDLL